MPALSRCCANGVAFAVVGAAALAVHGISRATRDLDLLVTDPVCLAESTWTTLRREGVEVTIRRGDPDDPLAGVLKFYPPGPRTPGTSRSSSRRATAAPWSPRSRPPCRPCRTTRVVSGLV
jgi:hypothetical protein